MKNLIAALVLIAIVIVCVGFYLGWFSFEKTKDPDEGKTHIGVTVDKDKIKDDLNKVKGKAENIGEKVKDKVNNKDN